MASHSSEEDTPATVSEPTPQDHFEDSAIDVGAEVEQPLVEVQVEKSLDKTNGFHPPSTTARLHGAPLITLKRSTIASVQVIGSIVRKGAILDPFQPSRTDFNLAAAAAEADAYLLLGKHDLIAECLFICPSKTYVELIYYPSGTLHDFIDKHHEHCTNAELEAFASQMLESVAYVHSMMICHSSLRLEAWLLDSVGNIRLSDFNAANIPAYPPLRIPERRTIAIEQPSHCMPRQYWVGSSVASDIFALGSSMYELASGKVPFEGEDLTGQECWERFQNGAFPDVEGKPLSRLILKCWKGKYERVTEILEDLNSRPCVEW